MVEAYIQAIVTILPRFTLDLPRHKQIDLLLEFLYILTVHSEIWLNHPESRILQNTLPKRLIAYSREPELRQVSIQLLHSWFSIYVCQALTSKGHQCKNRTIFKRPRFCFQHRNYFKPRLQALDKYLPIDLMQTCIAYLFVDFKP